MRPHRIEWECGCVTEGRDWDSSGCTGATHGCALGTKCTQSPLNHSAYEPFPLEPLVVINDDPLMHEAWDLTTRDRHNQYGTAEDAFRAYGHIWTGLLAHKLKEDVVIDATDVCLMMTGLKIAREVRNSKRDNVVDAHGYLSLLSRIRGWVNRR